MSDPVTVGLWLPDGTDFRKVGEVGTWAALSLEPRYNTPGTWSMSLPMGAQGLSITAQHVITFDFRGWRMTGLVEKPPGPAFDGTLTLEVSGIDALGLLGRYVCYPDPGSGAAAQLLTRYRDKGPAEAVLRKLIVANVVDRAQYPLNVAASQDRGTDVRVNAFFKNLLEITLAKVKKGGIGVRCGLVDSTPMRAQMWLEFYTPNDRSMRVVLSPDLGTVGTWRSETTAPTGTRAVVAAAFSETPYTISDVSGNILTIEGGADARHHLQTGDIVKFRGAGTSPAPLEDGTEYFAIRVDANSFKVAKTRAKALDGTPIDLTSQGSGVVKVVETSRLVREVADDVPEATWGRREIFVDARDEDADDDSVFVDRGEEALLGVAAATTFELAAVEADGMRFGTHYDIGDLVTVQLLPGTSTVTNLGAVRLASTPDAGTTVELVPGDPDGSSPLFKQAALIRALRAQVRALQEDS